MARRLEPAGSEEPHVSESTLYEGIQTILDVYNFSHGLVATEQEQMQCEDAIIQLVNNGQLSQAEHPDRFVGFILLQRLSRVWFEHALKEGSLSWDVTISHAMSVALMTALRCHAHRIILGYGSLDDSFLKWEDIDMRIG